MKRRHSRVHQILKNAGVIDSSNESDNSDIIENTPVVSPENFSKQAAAPTHLKCDSKEIENYKTLTKKYPGNEASDGNAISTTMTREQVWEVGEISIEAPAFSPLTPKIIHRTEGTPNAIEPYLHIVNKKAFEVGKTTIGAPANSQLSPKQASQLVIAERNIDGSDFSSLPPENFYATENRTDNQHASPLSSPVPDMSPATTEIFNILIGTEQDSDDSVVDPNYETDSDNSTTDDDSDARENTHISKLNQPAIQNKRSNSPSILTEISGNLIVENEDIPVLVPSKSEDLDINFKKRKNRDPSAWKINIEKRKRLRGEQYTTKKGKVMQARPLKPAKCLVLPKHKCISLVPEDERLKIYTEFRNLSSLQEQRHFVVNHVTKITKKRQTTQTRSRREFTLIYSLTVANENKIVCREFFLDTLNITGAFVKGALKKINPQGLLLPENRGKKSPPNKLMPSEEQFIHDQIQSFPAVESHYCRRDSAVRYLDPSLNISIMHREYQKLCAAKSIKAVSFEKYRSIFKTYKLSFHKPKKDLCKQCLAFKEMNYDEKSKHQDTYTLHLARKIEARQCRDEDKDIAQSNDKILSFNFDLQAVLNTPKGAAGPFFYVRKLAVYNLTVYNLGNQDVKCYMWDETEGKRGSIEISTCIHMYIMAHHNIKHVRMMSDGCGGQQKNYHFSSMCLLTLQEHASLQVIDHKFFESGHTHMECDSIHSKIEKKSKNIPVYTPDSWTQIVRLARTNPRPFSVTSLQHDDFKDFGMTNQFHSKPSNLQQKYGINDAVWLQYRKEEPDTIFMKTSFDKNESFKEMSLKKRRGKVIAYPVLAYSERFKISSKKKQDLMKLCTDLQIPKMYHSFYANLPYSKTTRDALPEPDAAEDSE